MTLAPRVSVIMPTYNSVSFLLSAVHSILNQSFRDFELVVIDDGSTDATPSLLKSISDSRLVVHTHTRNLGLASARNAGIEKSEGQYVAWLDSDDESIQGRLLRQVTLLDRNPHLALCGTWVRPFGLGDGPTWRYPRKPDSLVSRMLFDDPLATSSVMVRRQTLEESGGFNPDFAPAEDYDLWERITRTHAAANIPSVLTRYRIHDAQASVRGSALQASAVAQIQRRQLSRLGIQPDPDEWRVHALIGANWGRGLRPEDLPAAKGWLMRLVEANQHYSVFPRKAFAAVVRHRLDIVEQACQPAAWRRARVRVRTALQ